MHRGPVAPTIPTEREEEVIALVMDGASNLDIARALGFSTEGAKRHLTNIYNKLGVSTRLELCSQRMARYVDRQIAAGLLPLQARIAELEAALALNNRIGIHLRSELRSPERMGISKLNDT
jgi:DNA-binding CsgD family transcriptional regulator